MNHFDFLSEIKTKKIKPVYLIYGEETFLSRQIEEALIAAILTPEEREMNLAVFNQDPSPQELVGLIETIPFMGGKNVIVIRDTSLFKARKGISGDEDNQSGNDDILNNIFSNMPEYSIVVFTATEKVDKRRKIFKLIESYGRVVEMLPLKNNDVRPWLNSKLASLNKKMAPDAVEHILGAMALMPQISLGFLNNEIEKLALYSGRQVITLADAEAVLATIPEVSVFVMIEALSQKQITKALELLSEQLRAGEHPLRLMALIIRQIRMLWQAKELLLQGIDGRRLAPSLGVPPFIGEKIARQSRNFSVSVLKKALIELATADYDLKVGKADGSVLERIMIEMCLA